MIMYVFVQTKLSNMRTWCCLRDRVKSALLMIGGSCGDHNVIITLPAEYRGSVLFLVLSVVLHTFICLFPT